MNIKELMDNSALLLAYLYVNNALDHLYLYGSLPSLDQYVYNISDFGGASPLSEYGSKIVVTIEITE